MGLPVCLDTGYSQLVARSSCDGHAYLQARTQPLSSEGPFGHSSDPEQAKSAIKSRRVPQTSFRPRDRQPEGSGSQSRRCQGFLGISGKLPPSSCPCAASRSFIRSCSRTASCSFGVFPQPTLQSADRSFEKSEAGILTWIWSLSIRGHVLRVIQAAIGPRQDDPAWYWPNRLSSSPSHL